MVGKIAFFKCIFSEKKNKSVYLKIIFVFTTEHIRGRIIFLRAQK